MKKTLAAVAVLGAFAGSALAADVTLYGKVDLGLNYTHTDVDGVSSDNWGMKSGQNSGSRFGIKGTEQISDGLTVGFQLENGFDADDGRFKYGNDDGERMFGREARLFVQTDFGELGFGRMGGLDSGSGSYDIFGGNAGVFGTGWSGIGSDSAIFLGMSSRYDNMITYKSPTFGGVTVYAQASLKQDSSKDGDEASSKADRYYALGATGKWGALSTGVVASMYDYGHTNHYAGSLVYEDGALDPDQTIKEVTTDDDGYAVGAFVAYDFNVTKVTLGAQYFDGVQQSRGDSEFTISGTPAFDEEGNLAGISSAKLTYGSESAGAKGYGVMLGAVTPLGSGSLYTSIGYRDSENADENYGGQLDETVYQVAVGYTYPLSKRTYLYTAAGYTQEELDKGGNTDTVKTKTTEVVAGIVHNF
ncbi:MAG TPA: porin [Sutterellaceae bacterium]|nr:porin [Sutterellaceae bacterium]